MRNLLPILFLLACPVMMIFMMRGMHGGGQGTDKAGHDMHMVPADHDTHTGIGSSATPDLQAPDERIAALEHELAQLRSLQNRQSDHARAHRP
jgi:hypothetical protein